MPSAERSEVMTRDGERASDPRLDSPTRPNVVFLARNLKLGGAERAFVHYVNHVSAFRPVVTLLRKEGELLDDVHPRTSVYDLSQPLTSNFRAVSAGDPSEPETPRAGWSIPGASAFDLLVQCLRLRIVVRRTGASTVASFLMRSHLVALFTKLLLVPKLRVVLNVHEHMSDSAEFLYPTAFERLLMRWFVRHLFPRADLIVTVAKGVRRDLIETYGVPSSRVVVVHNPIDLETVRCRGREPVEEWAVDVGGPRVVAVGRLVRLKGFDSLIRAFASTTAAPPPSLHIVGDGPEHDALWALVRSLGLEDRVELIGNQSNPWKYIGQADLLVVSSRTEAFPYVVGEALALRCPVVSTDCSTGIAEYLEDGRCGLIVPARDDAALAEGMARLLSDRSVCGIYVERGEERIRRLDLEPAVPVFERAVATVVDRPAASASRPAS